MFDIDNLFMRWNTIVEALDGGDPVGLRSLLCMMVDYVASVNDMESVELLDELRPFIADVNADMGAMAI